MVQLILRTPALHARFLERQAQWRDDLTAELARRLELDPDTDLYPQLAAGMALTAFGAVLQRWSGSEGAEDPAELTDRAFKVIAPALDAVERRASPGTCPTGPGKLLRRSPWVCRCTGCATPHLTRRAGNQHAADLGTLADVRPRVHVSGSAAAPHVPDGRHPGGGSLRKKLQVDVDVLGDARMNGLRR